MLLYTITLIFQVLTKMKDLLLGSDHDLVIQNYDFVLTTDSQVLAQRIKQSLLFIKGEWFFNENIGTEYYPYIADKDLGILKATIANAIREVKGVKELIDFNANVDDKTRTMSVTFEVIDDLDNLIQSNIDNVRI